MKERRHPWVAPPEYVTDTLYLSFDDETVCALCGKKSPCACYVPCHDCLSGGCECGEDCPCCLEGVCSKEGSCTKA